MIARSTWRSIAAATLAAAVVAPAFGQAPQGQRPERGQGRRGAFVATIPVEALEKALSLTGDQKTKIKAVQDKLRAEMRENRPQPGAPPAPGQPGGRGGAFGETMRNANQEIMGILTDAQKTKLRELSQGLGGLRMVGIPMGLALQLNLTADQKSKLQAIGEGVREKMQAIPREERREKMRPLMEETRAKAMEVLTAAQKAQVEKFMKENPQGGRGQGRPGGPGRPPR